MTTERTTTGVAPATEAVVPSPAAHRVKSRQASWPPMLAVTRSGWPTGSAPAVSRSSSWTPSACSAEGWCSRRPVPPRLAYPPSHLDQQRHDSKTRRAPRWRRAGASTCTSRWTAPAWSAGRRTAGAGRLLAARLGEW